MAGKTPDSRSFRLISGSDARRGSGSLGVSNLEQIELRRRPRLSLTGEHFRLGSCGKIFSILDLSTDGMAIRVLTHEDLIHFPIAMRFEGVLNLKGVRSRVTAQVRHVSKDRVGCQFAELSQDVQGVIREFLLPEVLGRELKPIPSSDPGSLWYHGPSGTDLLFWRGLDGKFQRFAFYLYGMSVYWDEADGLSTGKIQEIDPICEEQGVIYFDQLMIKTDLSPDREKLDIAKALVLSSNFPDDLKTWCARHLEPRG